MSVTTLPTDSHDKLELYLSKNYVQVVDFMRIAKDRKFPALRDKKITSRLLLERTIGGKTMDCLILSIIDGEKRIFDVKSDLTLLIDVKPRMNRIGAMLAQINLADILSNQKNNGKQGYSIYRRVMKLIVTTDINEDYDRMMIDQDIFLLYLPQNIVDNNLKIPKAALSRRDRYLTSAEQVGKKIACIKKL